MTQHRHVDQLHDEIARLRAVLRRALTVLEERAWEHSAMVAEEIHHALGDGDTVP